MEILETKYETFLLWILNLEKQRKNNFLIMILRMINVAEIKGDISRSSKDINFFSHSFLRRWEVQGDCFFLTPED